MCVRALRRVRCRVEFGVYLYNSSGVLKKDGTRLAQQESIVRGGEKFSG